jgi:hypothetical protein
MDYEEAYGRNQLIEKFWVEHGGKPHMTEDLWFYESDFNMLMPVLEKIHKSKTYKPFYAKEPIGVEIEISMRGCLIELPDTSEGYDYVNGCYEADPLFKVYSVKNGMIKDIYHCVVKYIEWYNSTK